MTSRRGEDALTAKIAAAARPGKGVRVGIGDDAAVIDLPRGRYVVTTDTLVESVDFLRGEGPFWIGRRAAAANLSDLAAMGASPLGYLLTLGLPPGNGARFAWRIVEGVISKMSPYRAALWGGDLSRSSSTFVTICLFGRSTRPVSRAGARPGDRIFLTGAPGGAAAGLAVRRRRVGKPPSRADRAYIDPEPRVAFAGELARRRWATAMIDISDGLARDAHRLARASKVRLALAEEAADALRDSADDFELFFTASPTCSAAILALGRRLRTPVAEIGRVARGRGVTLGAGRGRAVADRGYDHLAS